MQKLQTMTSDAIKVTDLIKQGRISYSFEVTPDVDQEDINNIEVDPAFFSVTWHAKSHQCKNLDIEPLRIASFLRSKQKQVLLHLSCDMMKKDYLDGLLAFLQDKGICNLFVILGESFDPSSSDFKSTLELIKYIRDNTGPYFCIGVAGFCDCNDDKLLQLKEKIDNGVDFVITQAFFEANIYKQLQDKFDKVGIKIPIIPGVFPFETYNQLTKFISLCKVKVSNDLLEYVKNNEQHDNQGIKIIKKLVQTISTEYNSTHFHFFTLNKINKTCDLIKQLQ